MHPSPAQPSPAARLLTLLLLVKWRKGHTFTCHLDSNHQPNTNTYNIHAIILVIEASGSTTHFILQKYDLYCHLIDPRVPAFPGVMTRRGAAVVPRLSLVTTNPTLMTSDQTSAAN